MNNFKNLIEEEMRDVPPLPPQIKNNVQGNMGFFRFLGNTIELYLPRVLDAVVASLSGSSSENKSLPKTPQDPGTSGI
ncbi:MAG: hypothetical protein IPL49_03920 [Saprospirales bacterium]|nr:hypothetical protein [Saprospirales bacterium]MBK8490061.1 hypothetical protein [Saprospirales bacterium]